MEKRINIIIKDNDLKFLKGLNLIFSTNRKYNIIGTFSNNKELINCNILSKADLLLNDIDNPEFDTIETLKSIKTLYPKLKVIATAKISEKIYIKHLIKVGFHGFINKVFIPKELFMTIDLVLHDKFKF